MSIISRYISLEILKLFSVTLAGLLTVFLGFTTSTQLQDAAAGLIPATAALQLILLNTLVALEVLVPTTLFFAGVATLARMQHDYETVTILSAGVTPLQLTLIVMRIALVVAILAGLLSIFARPWAYKLSYQLESETLTELDMESLAPREFIRLASTGHLLYARAVDREGAYAQDVFVQRSTGDNPGETLIISAEKARLLPLDLDAPPTLQFHNGHLYRLDIHGTQDVSLDFDELRFPLPEDEQLTEYRRKAVPTAKLARSAGAKDVAEYQWRLVTPLLTLFLVALCVPLGTSDPGRSRAATIVSALVIYTLIFGLTGVLRTAVEQERIATQPGLWLAPLIPAGALAGYGFLRNLGKRLA